jgi:hypothetical protein
MLSLAARLQAALTPGDYQQVSAEVSSSLPERSVEAKLATLKSPRAEENLVMALQHCFLFRGAVWCAECYQQRRSQRLWLMRCTSFACRAG